MRLRTHGPRFALVLLAVALASCQSAAAQHESRMTPEPAPEIGALAVRSGQPTSLRAQRGKVVLLSFGYSSCADICPLTLATVGKVLARLGAAAGALRVFYVTVDPARDSAARLREFLRDFDPRIEGLVIPDRELRAVLTRWHVQATRRPASLRSYTRAGMDPEKDYSIEHTAALWLVDRRGRMRFRYSHDATADELQRGVVELLHE